MSGIKAALTRQTLNVDKDQFHYIEPDGDVRMVDGITRITLDLQLTLSGSVTDADAERIANAAVTEANTDGVSLSDELVPREAISDENRAILVAAGHFDALRTKYWLPAYILQDLMEAVRREERAAFAAKP